MGQLYSYFQWRLQDFVSSDPAQIEENSNAKLFFIFIFIRNS